VSKKKRENVRETKNLLTTSRRRNFSFLFSLFGQVNLYFIMSQSATLIRVAKHALDGTTIYPHNGQNTIYYQPFDLSQTSSNPIPTTKYLAYAIQQPREHLVPMASYLMRMIVRS
jgi:hypothetical protein